MGNIQMSLGYKRANLELSVHFIDHYLTGCAPVYPLIYIYSLRRLMDGIALSIQEIAEHFGLLDTDVVNAWRHFEKVGLVRVEGSGPNIAITFLPVSEAGRVAVNMREAAAAATEAQMCEAVVAELYGSETPVAAAPFESVLSVVEKPDVNQMSIAQVVAADYDDTSQVHSRSPALPPTRVQDRPQYSIEELTVYRAQSKDVERMFSKAEQALGKLLKYTDMNIIFGLYDWLRLPTDVIEYLLSYCEDHGHRNLRYIEKCAIDWADNGVDDLEKALVYVQTFDRGYRSILKQMGKLSAFPTPAQRGLMDKWLHEMKMPLEVILAACDKTTLNAEKPSLSYVDGILTKWFKKGIASMDGVAKADAEFEAARTQQDESRENNRKDRFDGQSQSKASSRAQKPKSNRFINFDQRKYDHAEIELLERQYLNQQASGK